MNAFRYEALESNGASVNGVIEAEDRKAALQLLGQRGLYPANLEVCSTNGESSTPTPATPSGRTEAGLRKQIRRKDITAFTREMSALLGAAIPIPQALSGLGEEETNLALRDVILGI